VSATRRRIPFGILVQAVCDAAGEDVSDVYTGCRHEAVVAARRAIVLLARRHTTMSFQEIARRLGRRTHSGVYQMHLAAHGTHNEAWLSLLERATELARVRADAVRLSQEERS